METILALTTRRSVRKYKLQPVPQETLDKILQAGIFAPTARNTQSPIIIVIKNAEVRKQLQKVNAEIGGMPEGFDPFFGAPLVLLVVAKKYPNCVYDGSCVISNLMNAAWSLGVASCWVHRAKEEMQTDFGRQLMQKLGIEDEVEGIGHVALGYAEGEIPQAKPRKEHWVYTVE